MIPTLFHIGPLPINSFGLMIACSLIVSIKVLERSFELHGIDKVLGEKFVMVGGIVGLIGARLWYLLQNISQTKRDLFGSIFSSAGFTFYGGFLVSWATLFFLCRKHNVPFKKFLNCVGPTMTIGYCIGRLGCQLSGDGDYGIATSSILGMSYATGVVPTPTGVKVFPTPFYESLWCSLILPLLLRIEKTSTTTLSFWSTGLRPFGAYLISVSLERFFIEFLRINRKVLMHFSEAQVIAIVLLLLGTFFLINRQDRIKV